jgi:hypothetical protein
MGNAFCADAGRDERNRLEAGELGELPALTLSDAA